VEACWAAWQSALAGDFAPLDAERARIASRADRTAATDAWDLALSAARWQALPTHDPAPDPARVAALPVSADTAIPIALACSIGELTAIAAFDRDALAQWIAIHERVPSSPLSRLPLELAHAYAALMRGDTDAQDLIATARDLETRAAAARLAHLVIDAATLAALAALTAGELDTATAIARRASRMARTESLPQHEYLAHLVLARLRRYTGHPHLATRILAALARVAPPQWHGWLRFELLLAGGEPAGALDTDARRASIPAHRAATHLAQLLTATDRPALTTAHAALHQSLAGWPALAREIDDLAIALDSDAPTTHASPALARWLDATDDALPPHLLGAATLGPRESAAWVAARPDPDRATRRILPLATRFLTDSEPIATATRPGRTEHTIAVLLDAGPTGLHNAELFQAVYGFAWNPVLHRSVLDVLLHRVRAALGAGEGAHAELLHQGERVTLTLHHAIHVPDPRCERPVDDRLLRTLATHGGGTARETAESLGLPLRTVQTALKHLVDEGICITEKRGRRIEYRVEDTTFSEPTRVAPA